MNTYDWSEHPTVPTVTVNGQAQDYAHPPVQDPDGTLRFRFFYQPEPGVVEGTIVRSEIIPFREEVDR